VYDITRKETFQAVDGWLELFRNFKTEDAVVILVGNKADETLGRQVSRE
jgi:GTPase SAR1 family protein